MLSLSVPPHPLHVSWGVKALEAGKHVLMQKPLCGEMDEANQFVAAAEASGKTVMCLPHFSAAIYKVRQLIAEEAIGRVSGARMRSSHGGPEIYYAEIRDIFGESGGRPVVLSTRNKQASEHFLTWVSMLSPDLLLCSVLSNASQVS